MLTAAVLMFTFASLDVAFHLRHNLDAFVAYDGDPIDEFLKTSYWLSVMKMVCYVVQTFIGDSILLYRCWVVYNKRWLVIVVPVLLWLGTTVCGALTIFVQATLEDSSGALLNASSLVPFITSMLCLTLATNVLTTSLIVHRIWKIRREVRHRSTIHSQSPLTSVLIVLIESGLMYTCSIVILFGLYMASNNAQYGVSNAVVQIIGITFNLIITSVDRGEAVEPSSRHNHSHISRHGSAGSVPLHLINIQTTVTRHPDKDISPIKSTSVSSKADNGSGKETWEGGPSYPEARR
ncbi:hypothetical protein CVT24_009632 [Panaeolus cyanescens]|uniref:Uncharacterized protein n=1 Tax=Panaeolus cyanescens TaxID=181874 RepID=A0A409YA04_9AGAR|nr:hypothetical protein CVT24_009632 [Panaeolus cyanescens]